MNKLLIPLAAILLLCAGGGLCWRATTKESSASPALTALDRRLSEDKQANDSPATPKVNPKFARLTDHTLHPKLRVDRLRNLRYDRLTPADKDRLYELLTHQPDATHYEDWWLIANEIMYQLREQGISPERYPEEMLALIENTSHHQVLRDYAIQHLGEWCIPTAEDRGIPHEQDPSRLTLILNTFKNLIRDPSLGHTSIPGTTLTMLANMREGGLAPEIVDPVITELSPWLSKTIGGKNNVSLVTRVTAIGSVGELGLADFTPTIRLLVANEDLDPTIRLNAIAALGHLGGEADLDSLNTLAQSSSKFRFAARSALKNIKQ